MTGCGHSEPCLCIVEAGDGVVVTGNGTAENPYVVSATDGGTYIETVDSSSVTWTLEGTGLADDPITIEAFPGAPAPAAVNVARFPASGTWTKPSGVTTVVVAVLGAGGGGGSGQAASHASVLPNALGGWGGGGGGFSTVTFNAALLTATVAVTVGTGGTAGASISVVGNGNAGGAGGVSSFGNYVRVGGGAGGLGGASTAALPTDGGFGESYGGYGQFNPTTLLPVNFTPDSMGGSGGGGGVGGGRLNGSAYGGSDGGGGNVARATFGLGGSTVDAGTDGETPVGVGGLPTGLGGGGGGGGGSISFTPNGAGYPGGNGGRGAGGGGGGAASWLTSGFGASGAGGVGGNGYVMVIAW